MSSWDDLKGTFQDKFRIGKNKTRLDATAPTVSRDFLLPDASIDMTGGATGQALSKLSSTTIGWQSLEAIGTAKTSLSAPDASWIESNAVYLKATYPTFSGLLGNVPDLTEFYDTGMALPSSFTAAPSTTETRYSVYALGLHVIVGTGGIFTSPDGITWTARRTGNPNAYTSIIYQNSLFMAFTNNCVSISSDAITWRTTNLPSAVLSCAFGAGVFVAVGNAGYIASSTDGILWYTRTTTITSNFSSIIYSSSLSLFIASGVGGSIATSPDGITWTTRTSGVATQISNLIEGAGLVIGIQSTGVITSPDGITWTPNTAILISSATDIIFASSTFIIVCGGGTGAAGPIATSPDGLVWTTRISPHNHNISSLAYDGVNFFAAGSRGATIQSATGATWTFTDMEFLGHDIRKIVFQNSVKLLLTLQSSFSVVAGTKYFISGVAATPLPYNINSEVIAESGSEIVSVAATAGQVLRSVDGLTWTSQLTTNRNLLSAIAFGAGVFVAVGNNGAVVTSPTGVTWTTQTSGTTEQLNCVTFASGLFVAVGFTGKIITSPDGVTWTTRVSGTANTLNYIIFANALFVIVGSSGTTLTSPDGITWTVRVSGTANALLKTIFANALFVSVGSTSTITTSPDGITWTVRTTTLTATLTDIVFGNSIFMAVGAVNAVITSPDGITWTTRTNMLPANTKVAFGAGKFVASSGVILAVSTDGITWTNQITGIGIGSIPINDIYFSALISSFLTVGGLISKSTDAISWTPSNIYQVGLPDVRSMDTNGTIIVAVGSAGAISTSTDGVNWTSRRSGINTLITKVKYLNGQFIAITAFSNYLVSSDGITWTLRAFSHLFNILAVGNFGAADIEYNSGLYVAVGATSTSVQGVVLTSSDLINWTIRASAEAAVLNCVAYGNGLYMVGSSTGFLLTSSDGITWSEIFTGSTTAINKIMYNANNTNFIFSNASEVFVTANGTTIINSNAPIVPTILIVDPTSDYIILATNAKCYISKTGLDWSFVGDKWNNNGAVLATIPQTSVIFQNTIYVGLNGRAINNGANTITKTNLYSYVTGTHFYAPKANETRSPYKEFVKALP